MKSRYDVYNKFTEMIFVFSEHRLAGMKLFSPMMCKLLGTGPCRD